MNEWDLPYVEQVKSHKPSNMPKICHKLSWAGHPAQRLLFSWNPIPDKIRKSLDHVHTLGKCKTRPSSPAGLSKEPSKVLSRNRVRLKVPGPGGTLTRSQKTFQSLGLGDMLGLGTGLACGPRLSAWHQE